MCKSISIYLLCCLCLFVSSVSARSENSDKELPTSYPIADGTFIQEDLVAHWDDAHWLAEFASLKEAGMHYLVFAPTLQTDIKEISRTIYPSDLPNVKSLYKADLVENCLRNAKTAGFKVFLGLNISDKWWDDKFSPDWLYNQMKIGNQVADELVKKYKSRYEETMYGWYWVWEISNLHYTTTAEQDMLVNALNINIDYLNKITPKMPFMLCPYVNYKAGNSKNNRAMWQYMFAGTHFREGDIFAPQDCVGAGGLKLGMVDEWFNDMSQAVKSKPGLLFWSDAETFDQRFWTSAPLDRFIEQMKIVKPYVSNIISFAYSHYYSPTLKTKGFHEAYLQYVRTGLLPINVIPDQVTNLLATSDSKGMINLRWNEPLNKKDLAGYYIFKDKHLIGNLQYKSGNKSITGFQDKNRGKKEAHRYEVCSYTCSGITSTKSSIEWK